MARSESATGKKSNARFGSLAAVHKAYQANVCYRAYSGHSETIFQRSLAKRPLSSIAVIQGVGNLVNRRAAFGQ